MYTVYGSQNTGAFAIEAALKLAGEDYDYVTVNTRMGAHREAEFIAINPRQQVPALRLPDGSVMTESAAMLLHVADSFPTANLLPEPGTSARAQAYRWIVFLSANIYEADLRYYYAERYTAENGNPRAVREAALAQLDSGLAIIADVMKGRSTLLDSGWSLCDLYLTMLCQWHPESDRLFADHPALRKCVDETLSLPAVRAAAEKHPEMLG